MPHGNTLRLRHRGDALRRATFSATGHVPTVDAWILTVVAGACRDHQQLRFDYLARDGVASRRGVEPHRLVCTSRRWYLLAWDSDRKDWRTFRADCVRVPLPTGPRFTPREPPEDAANHVLRGVDLLAWKHEARIQFHGQVQEIADLVPSLTGLLHPVEEHAFILETGCDSLHDLVRYLTNLNTSFKLLDPPELRTLLRKLAGRYSAAAIEPRQLQDKRAQTGVEEGNA